jgi:hypothetical protein
MMYVILFVHSCHGAAEELMWRLALFVSLFKNGVRMSDESFMFPEINLWSFLYFGFHAAYLPTVSPDGGSGEESPGVKYLNRS